MADAPWRCSECGTVNEPVANACRTCGRWPSLFDLQESVVDEGKLDAPAELRLPRTEVEAFEPETFEDAESAAELEPEPVPEGARRRRLLTSVIVPLAFVVYLVISIVFGDR